MSEESSMNQDQLSQDQIKQIKKLVQCGLCDDILWEPATLYCQHTFCSDCLENLEDKCSVKCPQCGALSFLSPSHNYKIKEFIEKIYTSEELKERQSRIPKKFKNNQKEKLKKDIRKEVWRNVINENQVNTQPVFGNIFNPMPNVF